MILFCLLSKVINLRICLQSYFVLFNAQVVKELGLLKAEVTMLCMGYIYMYITIQTNVGETFQFCSCV